MSSTSAITSLKYVHIVGRQQYTPYLAIIYRALYRDHSPIVIYLYLLLITVCTLAYESVSYNSIDFDIKA